MVSSESQSERSPAGDRTIRRLGEQIASRRVHVGGASAAAAAASLAAASAELVVALSIRRSTPQETRIELERDRDRLRALREELLAAADADEAALGELMRSYRDEHADQVQLLQRAASSAVTIARNSAEVVDIAAANIGRASRFTVSDLGSAAAIAFGSFEAAAMTATVNLQLLEEQPGANLATVSSRRQEVTSLRSNAAEAAERATSQTMKRIASPGPAGA